MRIKVWVEVFDAKTEARYELRTENGKPVSASVIGSFTDEEGERHQFVRWDSAHGRFHKHCMYERKQRTEYITTPLQQGFEGAKADLRQNWAEYKKGYIKWLREE